MKDKIALVFSGGGGKGAYEVGVWKALKTLDIEEKVSAISGNSIGALNAVFFMCCDLMGALRLWRNVTQEDTIPLKITDFIKLWYRYRSDVEKIIDTESIMTMDKLDMFFSENINFDDVSKSKILGYVSAYNMDKEDIEYFKLNGRSENEIKDILKASTSLPLIFDPISINNCKYRDGCIKDNIPIEPLYREGYRKFIVVSLEKDEKIDKEKYKDATFFEIIPSCDIGTHIVNGSLDFNPKGANKRLKQGYLDTMRYFDKIKYNKNVVDTKN